MTRERWEEVARIFEAVIQRLPSERASFLLDACGDDVALRHEVESFLDPPTSLSPVDDLAGQVASDLLEATAGLPAGTLLGPYRVSGLLGVGGMGEVYRAHDTTLRRDVALKLLPALFRNDTDRIAKLTHEAQVLAALNHPNIAAIYGVEDASFAGSGTTVPALVLEFIEGPTLADRISRGPIPLAETLTIARQIAEALQAAHERGVVHRDLKPANVKVREDGTVKVLDFGLAMLATATNDPEPSAHEVFGTVAYMSPEHAAGGPVDKRSDIWAFGCVLYEMLTGDRAFLDPNWERLPSGMPRPVHTLLQRCLEKMRNRRISDFSTVVFLIEEATDPTVAATPPSTARSGVRTTVVVVATAVCAATITSVGWWAWSPAVAPARVSRFTISLPPDQHFPADSRPLMALSQDGAQLAYFASNQLYLRSMSSDRPYAIPGSEINAGVANNLAFSPDGRWVAYWDSSDRTLKKISVDGGTPITLCRANNPLGVDWHASGLLFADPETGELFRVGADGGTPEVILSVSRDEYLVTPRMLPDGRHVMFALMPRPIGRIAPSDIVVQAIGSSERRMIVAGAGAPRLVRTGHIVYAADGALFAAPFDEQRLELAGERVPLVEGIRSGFGASAGFPAFDVSPQGALAYIAGTRPGAMGLALIGRDGATTTLPVKPGFYETPRVSPDGKRVAIVTQGADANIWIYELDGGASIRQLTSGGRNRFPVWSPDGVRLAFQSNRDGDLAIWWQPANGSAPAERLTSATRNIAHTPEAWSHDQRLLYDVAADARHSLWMLSLADQTSTPVPDVSDSGVPVGATFSPDGRWIAHQFGSAGPGTLPNVFVRPFPLTGTKYQIPAGIHPFWSRDGRDLFYNQGPSRPLAVVSLTTAPVVSFGEPKSLPQTMPSLENALRSERDIDAAIDGRLVSAAAVEPGSTGAVSSAQIQVVLNWGEELKRRVVPR